MLAGCPASIARSLTVSASSSLTRAMASLSDIKASSGAYKFLLNGVWKESSSGSTVGVLNPKTNEACFQVQDPLIGHTASDGRVNTATHASLLCEAAQARNFTFCLQTNLSAHWPFVRAGAIMHTEGSGRSI